MKSYLFAAILFNSALLVACGDKPAAPLAGPTEVTVFRVVERETPVTFEYTAQTESSRQVEIRTRVSGFLEKRNYKEGSIVKEGQVLFEMDKKPLEAQLASAKGEMAAQQARLAVAQAELARVRPLAEQNALSKKDLDDAVGKELTARAAVDVAKANVLTAELNLGYATIKSPLLGLSSFAKSQDGAYLNAAGGDSLLTTVAALDPMRVVFSVSENEMLKYRKNVASGALRAPSAEEFEVAIVLADGSVFPDKGRITFADPSYAQATGTLLIRAEVANPDGVLKPGQFVQARLIGAAYPKGIVVPQKAVQQGAQGSFVWLADGEGKAQIRQVTVGQWIGNDWLVLSGLKDGDAVIVDGFSRLAPGAPVKVLDKPAPADAR